MMTTSSIETELFNNGELVYTNKGDSMYPLIRPNGDILIIKKQNEGFKKYDIPLYKRDSGKYILHRIIKVNKDGTYTMCGDNRYTKESGLTDKNMLGILHSIVRNGKEIKMNDIRCRIYAHLWCDFFIVRKAVLILIYSIKKLSKKTNINR